MSGSEWNDDERGSPAPLPAHERAWRHPSEVGEQEWTHSEPSLTIGRGLTAATGTIGGLLALVVMWTMLPTQAGRSAVATERTTIANRSEVGLVAGRSVADTEPTNTPTHTPDSTTDQSPATTLAVQLEPAESAPLGEPPPTYQLQQSSNAGAVAVAVNDGRLVITTSQAIAADVTVELLLPDGRRSTSRVLFVDQRSGLAVLAAEPGRQISSFIVATSIEPGDLLTFLGDVRSTVTVQSDSTIDSEWSADASIREGTPVINQRGELVALCSHLNGTGWLVRLSELDELQHAVAGDTAIPAVWMGIELSDDPVDELSVSAVEPGGPAAEAGLTSGDVILTVDDQPVTNGERLAEMLAAHQPGDVLHLTVRRADGSNVAVSIELVSPRSTL